MAAALALRDLVDGLQKWRLWGVMGWQDIKQRYRRSVIGPFWLTLTLAILVAALSMLYGRLMEIPLERYVPHLALGFIGWQLIQGIIAEGCNVFIAAESWIKSVKLPLSLFVYRVIWRHILILGHNAIVYVAVAAIFGIYAGLSGLLVLPALLLILFNGLWVCLLFGLLSARFRDFPQIVNSLLRVAFFVTPIIWLPEQLGTRAYLAQLNPFTYFIEILRAPLLGEVPDAMTWLLAFGVTVIGWSLTWLMFVRFRRRVPYWL